MEKIKISDIPIKDDNIPIPKWLINKLQFRAISTGVPILYGLMLEKTPLIQKNNWIDENQNLYILYPVEEMIDNMCVEGSLKNAKEKINRMLKQLEKLDLIEVEKQKKGKPKKIYLKNIEF